MEPTLSVVVGSNNARSTIVQCLSVLESQRKGKAVEIVVVDNSSDGTAEIIEKQFPAVRLLKACESSLIPQLWGMGISETTGEIVAITTAHCIPARNWIYEIIDAHASGYAGIGGAIENDESAGLLEWGIYFLRYSPYMLPFEAAPANEIAGDNASYKRSALEGCKDSWRDGFWEPTVHRQLRAAGLFLLLTPRVVVYHKKSFGLFSFAMQRFLHGRQFGRSRSRDLSRLRKLIYVIMSPFIPVVFFWRIARQLFTKRRNAKRFVASLPLLTLFLMSWSLGEFAGYVSLTKGHEASDAQARISGIA